MSWIETIGYESSSGRLRRIYDRVRGAEGQIDNILRLHSLRPHTLESHLALYKSALHHTGNRLPTWLLEAIGTYVSLLNGCEYCLDHHFAGLRRLLADAERAGAMRTAMETGDLTTAFDDREVEILRYAERLTQDPATTTENDIERLRAVGLGDGEILEVNQVTSYFAYANRTVQGLGGTTEGEVLGLSPDPSDDLGEWRHG
ncbi:MAG: peroxidase-related enzyme [Gemmatimonadales bacterium]